MMTAASDMDRCDQMELVSAYVLRALPLSETSTMEAHIAACAQCREELQTLRPIIDSFAAWPIAVLRPSTSTWDRLLERIESETPKNRQPAMRRDWREPDWEEAAPGISCKLLASNAERDRVTMLVRLAPGVEYPPHTHAGVEELYLLHGELWIDDKKLHPGDYHESAQEELKAAQEELLSNNEEFQSTNEELETSREELQSANEELTTTNDELRYRNRELGTINIERTEARDYADAIVETMREPLLVLDEELRVIRANREFYEFFRTAPQFIEHGLFFALGDREWDIPELRHLLEEILPASTSFRDCEITTTFPRIGSRTLRLNARRLRWSGRILILLAIEDITERQAALNALVEANRRKDEFLAMLAHELRNPLAAIRNGLEIWRRGADAAMQERAQAMVERQLQKEIRLVDDLLDVSRISLGKISLKKDAVDLVQIVKQAVEELHPRLDARRHQLMCSLPDEPVTVEGDATRLEQIVANLLSNSIKFTEPGGSINVELQRDAREAVICVSDTGIGIAPELLPAVFDLFVQGDRSLERTDGGLGLGLTLVRRLIQLHGGSIEAHSGGRGQGSQFTVRLPVQPRSSAAVGVPASVSPPRGNGRNDPRRILIVDDSADAAESSAMLLRLDDHEIHIAFDGPSALEASRSFKPEIVFLDIGLPGLNGLEVARRLRQSPQGAGVMLVALSGYGQPDDHRRSLEAGFDRHLVKPVDHEQLDAVIVAYDGNGVRAGGDEPQP